MILWGNVIQLLLVRRQKLWISSVGTPLTIYSVRILELIRMLAKFNSEGVVLQNLELVEVEEQLIPKAVIPTAITVTSLDLLENLGYGRNLGVGGCV